MQAKNYLDHLYERKHGLLNSIKELKKEIQGPYAACSECSCSTESSADRAYLQGKEDELARMDENIQVFLDCLYEPVIMEAPRKK